MIFIIALLMLPVLNLFLSSQLDQDIKKEEMLRQRRLYELSQMTDEERQTELRRNWRSL